MYSNIKIENNGLKMTELNVQNEPEGSFERKICEGAEGKIAF